MFSLSHSGQKQKMSCNFVVQKHVSIKNMPPISSRKWFDYLKKGFEMNVPKTEFVKHLWVFNSLFEAFSCFDFCKKNLVDDQLTVLKAIFGAFESELVTSSRFVRMVGLGALLFPKSPAVDDIPLVSCDNVLLDCKTTVCFCLNRGEGLFKEPFFTVHTGKPGK